MQEWSKFSNYETATQVPWLLHLPSSDDDGEARRPKLSQVFSNVATSNIKEDTTTTPRLLNIANAAKEIQKPVQLLDLFPTLVDAAKLPKLKSCISRAPRAEVRRRPPTHSFSNCW